MDKETFVEKYLVDRNGTYSMKWDGLQEKFGTADLLPMWIADMEFRVCDEIQNALAERVSHGVFGYTNAPEEYFEALNNWMTTRYHFPVKKEWVRFTTGCVLGLAYAINCFTEPGDHCMILSPVYYPFFNVVTNNNRQLTNCEMDYDEKTCSWSLDYDKFEKQIAEDQVKMLLLCSPHNPCGKLWTEEELIRIFDICRKYKVLVASDEIHQDLVIGEGKQFVPAATVKDGAYRDMILTINSATKTFNLATLLHGHMIIPDDELRAKYDRYASGINRTEISVLGMIATMKGYEQGSQWLDGLHRVIRGNYEYMKEQFAARLPQVKVCCLDATYLVMVDLRGIVAPEKTMDFVLNKCHLGVDFGEWFGEAYKGFVRINVATDPEIIRRAVENIIHAYETENC